MAACRTGTNGTNWAGHDGYPQSCECHRQLFRYFCGPAREDGARCDRYIAPHGKCYELEGVAREQQVDGCRGQGRSCDEDGAAAGVVMLAESSRQSRQAGSQWPILTLFLLFSLGIGG